MITEKTSVDEKTVLKLTNREGHSMARPGHWPGVARPGQASLRRHTTTHSRRHPRPGTTHSWCDYAMTFVSLETLNSVHYKIGTEWLSAANPPLPHVPRRHLLRGCAALRRGARAGGGSRAPLTFWSIRSSGTCPGGTTGRCASCGGRRSFPALLHPVQLLCDLVA
jgi:hypothetical protein